MVSCQHLFRGGLFFKQPSYWVRVVERTRTGMSLAKPDPSDSLLIARAVMPWVFTLCGCFLGWVLAALLARRAAVRSRFPEAPRSARTATSLIALIMGWAMWLWVLLAITDGMCQVGILPHGAFLLMAVIAAMAWTAGCLSGWPRLVFLDTARLIYLWPARLATVLGGLAAAPLLWIVLCSLL